MDNDTSNMAGTQNQRLISLFDESPLETEFSNTYIQEKLHIGPYSRRIEDVRYGHYLQLGFLVLNRMERKGGLLSSYYRKVRAADYPAEHSQALAAYERHMNAKDRVKVPKESKREETYRWFVKTFNVKPKPAPEPQAEPAWRLTPP